MLSPRQSNLSQHELQKLFRRFALIPPQSPVLPASKSLPDPSTASPASISMALPPPSESDPSSQSSSVDLRQASPSTSQTSQPPPKSPNVLSPDLSGATISLAGFTSFLLSSENSPFTDYHGKVWHDMTRPLSEYYISSSHNTYLVGHQLVGVSTIEGYIRALLHSCRSVEREPSCVHLPLKHS